MKAQHTLRIGRTLPWMALLSGLLLAALPASAAQTPPAATRAAVNAAQTLSVASVGIGLDIGFGRGYVGYRSHRYRYYRPYRYPYYIPRFYGFGYGPWYGAYYAYDRYAYAPDAGALDLNIKPKKAQVWLDGEYVGPVDAYDGFPRYLWMRAGTHHLVIYLEGYESLAREVRVRRGEILALRLRLAPGESKTPEELFAQLRPQEKRRDSVQRAPRDRPAARYQRDRRFEREDRRRADESLRERADTRRGDRQGPVAVPRGGDSISRDQRSEPGRLRLRVEPADAVVYLDGRLLGSGEELERLHSDLLVDPGTHRLEVTRPGYSTWSREVDVTAGETVDLEAELEPEQ